MNRMTRFVSTAVVAIQLPGCVADVPANGSGSSPSPASQYGTNPGDAIDMLDFFISKHPDQSLSVSQTVSGNWAYETKWTSQAFEIYTWDSDYIYLQEDHEYFPGSDSQGITSIPGTWAKRNPTIGETLDNPTQVLTLYGPNCQPKGTLPWPSVTLLEAHIPDFDAGPMLGIQDVVVLKTWKRGQEQSYDHNWYSRDWGWIGWADSTDVFTPFTERGAPPLAPDLSVSCLASSGDPATAFLTSLYNGLLGRPPDPTGEQYWLDRIHGGAGCAEVAASFLVSWSNSIGYSSVANADYVTAVYTGLLSRAPDPAGYQDSLDGLDSGTISRTQLAESILGSAEFNSDCISIYGFGQGAGGYSLGGANL